MPSPPSPRPWGRPTRSAGEDSPGSFPRSATTSVPVDAESRTIEDILVIHTEASDRTVAEMLTRMMGPRVLLVPSLGQIPSQLLARVFVFTNGVRGEGPFGCQPDVFDTAPGDPGYTPLRRVVLVTWRQGRQPRVLRPLQEIRRAERAGALRTQQTGVVVNMPFLIWPGGHR